MYLTASIKLVVATTGFALTFYTVVSLTLFLSSLKQNFNEQSKGTWGYIISWHEIMRKMN